MIDLAGSEKHKKTAEKTQIEGANINRSLLALGTCIAAIIRAQSEPTKLLHIPYRDSKLTRVLKESLVDPQCNILMIMCLNPHPSVFDETANNTVAFANKIRTLKVEHKNRINLYKPPKRPPTPELNTMEEVNRWLGQFKKSMLLQPGKKPPIRESITVNSLDTVESVVEDYGPEEEIKVSILSPKLGLPPSQSRLKRQLPPIGGAQAL
jgi:kinesin family member 18/19